MLLKKYLFSVSILFAYSFFLFYSYSTQASSLNPNIPTLSGTFIQYQSWMLQLDPNKWTHELDSMKNIGIHTIIIQWLKSDQTRFYPIHALGNDPTEIILSYADKNNIKVILGLEYSRDWWTKWDDESFLSAIVKKNIQFGKNILLRYQHHPSFSGWYIPYEMSDADFDETEIKNLHTFLKDFSSGVKKLSKKKYSISLSTFFSNKIPPAAVQENYMKILYKSGIDILLVQDGVGTNSWNSQIADKVTPYIAAYRTAAINNKIHVWNIVESFTTLKDASGNNTGRAPTDINRLKEQLKVLSSTVPEKILTFDFFHYMSPHRGEAQKQLYDHYIQELKSTR